MLKKTMLANSLLIAFSGGATLLGTSAYAQEQPAELQRVEVTGSAIKRIDAETALPVQIITRQAIAKTGAVNVEQLLLTISSTSSSGGLTGASSSGSTTGGISAVSIHGLGSSRTLVLVNGRRTAPYGIGFVNDSVSVDVNSIPLAAIDRIEVLEDGASAIYGSDAIAGVINFILRKDFKGVEVSGEYGNSTHGGADIKKGSVTVGFGDIQKDKYNLMLVASAQREGSLIGSQRGFASRGIFPEYQNDTTSGNTFPANIAAQDGSFGSRNPTNPTCPGPHATLDPLLSPRACRFDPSPLVTLIPQTERYSFLANGHILLSNDIELYAEASYNQNRTRVMIQPVPLSDQFDLPSNNPLFNIAPYNGKARIVLQPSSPFYPTAYVQGQTGGATPNLLVRFRDALNGNRDFTDIAEAPRFVIGAKGLNYGWNWDSNILYSSSKVREQVNGGYPLYSKILPLLNTGTVNFFGPNTPAVQAQVDATGFTGDAYSVKTSITSLSLQGSKDLAQLPAGTLTLAVGGEYRRESYNFQSSTAVEQGDVSGYGGNLASVSKSRGVTAVFGELAIPILKGFDADLAARYDHYEGVGNSFTPKVGLRFQIIPEILVRGSVSRGFRAPSLADLYTPSTTGVSPTGLTDSARCPTTGDGVKDCSTQFTVTNAGNADLKPEKSTNATIGLVLQPLKNLSASVDYFNVRLKDTINSQNAGNILANPIALGGLIIRGPVDPNFPNIPGPITNLRQDILNLGETKLAGLELNANYQTPTTDFGKFTFDVRGTYYIQYDAQNVDGSFTGQIDQPNGSSGGVIPRWKHYLTIDWTRGAWDWSVAQNFQKHYHDGLGSVEDPTNTPRDVASYITYDTQVTYAGFKSWKLTLGARNVFDRDPPYANVNSAFQAGYDPTYGDPRGRFVYGRATYAF